MKRIIASALVVLAVGGFLVVTTGASNSGGGDTSYRIELDNAFGLVNGADFKVAGVRAGTINSIELCYTVPSAHCQSPMHALVGVQVTEKGFGSFHSDVSCSSRPQSLIGEYFVECDPGSAGQPALKNNATIPITRTHTTIAADLLNNIMRLPYRQRFSLIINELGAAVAGRSGDLQEALRRAVPALTETDNLLNLLANDSHTLQSLTTNSDTVITALANNSKQVQRFIEMANRTATHTANQASAFQATWHKLPAFLEELRPTMVQLGAAADANVPVLANLNAASGQLARLFADIPPFAKSSRVALHSLGKAAVTGKVAVIAARPAVKHLNQFAKHTPELSKNLAIVLRDLDNRGRAVEADPRSPGGKGYTGLEALLQYVFNQTVSINAYSKSPTPYHMLTVDGFVDKDCSPYANQKSVASGLKSSLSYRRCYAWLGPNQPGINERDPSAPSACVPDPGYGGEGRTPSVGAPCKLTAASDVNKAAADSGKTAAAQAGGSGTAGSTPTASSGAKPGGPAINLHKTIGGIVSALSGVAGGIGAATNGSSGTAGGGSSSQAQQLLNYLLAP